MKPVRSNPAKKRNPVAEEGHFQFLRRTEYPQRKTTPESKYPLNETYPGAKTLKNF